jgi:endonuclease YncB( thermonuclease family)
MQISQSIADAKNKTCTIESVYDGDSLRVSCLNKPLRLACIDAPELNQPHGVESRDYLNALVAGKDLEIVTRGEAGFGRTATIIYVDNVNLQERLLSLGMVWYYPQYGSKCRDIRGLKEAESTAKASKTGLWGTDNPISPWTWRRNH